MTREWIWDTVAAVEDLAVRFGWRLDWAGGSQNTGTLYCELNRDCVDEDGDDDVETIKVRIADHPTLYCREDISLCPNPGGDDHGLADLESLLTSLRHPVPWFLDDRL